MLLNLQLATFSRKSSQCSPVSWVRGTKEQEYIRKYKNIAYYEKLSKNEKVGKPQQEDKTR